MISHDFFQDSFKISSINSIISDGAIVSLNFSYLTSKNFEIFENNQESSLDNEEIPGISSSYQLSKSDNLIGILVLLDDSSIIQMAFKTKGGNTHNINNVGILSHNKGITKYIDFEGLAGFILCPMWSRENSEKKMKLHDILCFDTEKRIICL